MRTSSLDALVMVNSKEYILLHLTLLNRTFLRLFHPAEDVLRKRRQRLAIAL